MLRLIFLLLMSSVSLAAEFIASVSSNQIELGHSVQLSLTLKDAKASGAPELYPLTKDFTVYSQQQYSTYSSTNGSVTSETGWDITMLPSSQGTIVIPSIKIKTNKGLLSTQPINLKVLPAGSLAGKNNSNKPLSEDSVGVSLIATTNKTTTYIKEPILYTLKIVSYRPVTNVTLDDIKSSDAIIDKVGHPKQYEQSIGGMRAHIIEIKYYVTPIIAGKIEIQPAVIRGEAQDIVPNPQQRGNRMGMLHNFFFDDIMQFKPFTVRGEKITLNAQPAVTDPKSWLPLQNLSITEEWTGADNPKVGETIIRKIKLVATGSFGNQLPSTKKFMDLKDVKVYADNPELADDLAANTDMIVGTKIETYSIVPTTEGKLSLPEVKIKWWNLATKQEQVATLPAKTFTVSPSAVGAGKETTVDFSQPAGQESDSKHSSDNSLNNIAPWVYVVLGSLLSIIFALIFTIWFIIKRKNSAPKVVTPNKAEAKLQEINTPAELRDYILNFAVKNWGAEANLTLNQLGTYLSDASYVYDIDCFVGLSTGLNSALYASGTVDIQALIAQWLVLKDSVRKHKPHVQEPKTEDTDYINLNPT